MSHIWSFSGNILPDLKTTYSSFNFFLNLITLGYFQCSVDVVSLLPSSVVNFVFEEMFSPSFQIHPCLYPVYYFCFWNRELPFPSVPAHPLTHTPHFCYWGPDFTVQLPSLVLLSSKRTPSYQCVCKVNKASIFCFFSAAYSKNLQL